MCVSVGLVVPDTLVPLPLSVGCITAFDLSITVACAALQLRTEGGEQKYKQFSPSNIFIHSNRQRDVCLMSWKLKLDSSSGVLPLDVSWHAVLDQTVEFVVIQEGSRHIPAQPHVCGTGS